MSPRARCWREVAMASHRRYTSANGDALASAVTYALTLAIAPVLLLGATLTGGSGWLAETVRTAVDRTLPEPVAALVDRFAGEPSRGLTGLAAVMVVWTSVRAVRALRTAYRAVCGQNAGSGNPIADNLRDVLLAGAVYLTAALTAALVAGAPEGAARWVGALALGVLVAVTMRLLPWPGAGRPTAALTLAAAVLATALVVLLGVVGGAWLEATMPGRSRVYGSVAAGVAAVVWLALSVRAVLRALSLASVLTDLDAPAPDDPRALWVVVPAFDEAAGLPATLGVLAAQTDTRFSLVVVDNASTDDTAGVARRFAETAPFPVHVVTETERGVGCAVDAGMRFAIAHGAGLLARTDADALPRPDWVARVRRRFALGAEVVCGASVPRADERPSPLERWLLPGVQRTLAVYGRYRREHRGPEYLAPYVLCHGHNLALTADVYERSGGAVRRPLEDGPEDVALLNRARRVTARVVRAEDVVVENSLRRLREYGVRNTLLWYWDRRYRPADPAAVHVR